MPKMSTGDLKALLAAEKADALAATSSSKLSEERSKALDYYMGDMTTDMPSPEGRSKAVSTDVSDTVEGLMPSLMEIFTAGDEVVKFEPVSAEDVQAAEQETDYINHVFYQNNPGFLVLYSFIKDALLSKVGVVKVWWETKELREKETYLDQPPDSFALIVANPSVEVIEHSEHVEGALDDEDKLSKSEVQYTDRGQPPDLCAMCEHYVDEITCDLVREDINPEGWCRKFGPAPPNSPPRLMLHDVTVETVRNQECARVEGVPPEEFGISRNARSIRDADYCFHDVIKSQAKLIEQGYDEDQIDKLPSYVVLTGIEEQARDTVEESTLGHGDPANKAARLIRITEHYVRMDYEGNGKAALYRVTTGGDESEVLIRDDKPDVIEEEVIPFAAMTPIIITHRFFGRSIADLVMDIQRIKTALLRAMLDNAYLSVNPRTVVAESHATETTLDDLLVSRPGGIVRVKMTNGIEVLKHPDISGEVFGLLQYQDATREWRTGVSRQGQGTDPNALQNQVATIANQMFNAAQAKTKLIARIFAETGIRDLFSLLHRVVRKHGSQAQTVRLRNQWVQVDPREWKNRNDMTVNVGLGTGSKGEQLSGLQLLIGAQEKAIAAGGVSKNNLAESSKELTKLLGYKDHNRFFSFGYKPDPAKPDPDAEPIQLPPDPKAAEAEARLELEKAKAGADVQISAQKAQADQQASVAKIEAETRLKTAQAAADAQIKSAQIAAEAQLKREQAEAEALLRREQAKADFDLKAEQMRAEFAMRREEMVAEATLRREQMLLDAQVKREIGEAQAAAKASVGLSNVELGGQPG